MRTQVAIIGAGPAGLLLGQLLARSGIHSIILEARDRRYIETRVRAGVLEHQTASVIDAVGAGARLAREALRHDGVELVFSHQAHRIDFDALTGKSMTIYGQQEVVKDLVEVRLAGGLPLLFEVSDVRLGGLDSDAPQVCFVHEGTTQVLDCDFVAGCDGFHGISRASIPEGVLTVYERVYPYAWLGILAEAPPMGEIIYARHEHGFALHSLRSPTITRLYLQCAPEEPLERWPDSRIWDELQRRLTVPGGPRLNEGPVLQKSVTPMRSFVVEPMQYGRLFLAGDAAHIVPPTGAKGMNQAAADVQVLSRAFLEYFRDGSPAALRNYSSACLDRVWKVQRFSRMMTDLLHLNPADTPFDTRCREAELSYLATSAAGAATFAENYVGLPVT
ncbi:MAG TPA: 4-hydroxybenzoate 3-monooxygenase [Steroidobacteraceae bacterium]|nr:4-hydroxybenzoate 3-monooxygenase [Steroidobacteraceae bacterium]